MTLAWMKKHANGSVNLKMEDEEALALWQWFRDESLVEFNRLYNELQVEFDSYNGEAFYNDKMDAVVDILSEKGLLVESEGAQVVNLEKYGIEHPALIKKSDGATLYITRDLAAALYRKRNTNLQNPSMLLVKSNLPTSNNSRQYYKRWATIGAKTLSMFRLDW